MTTSAEANAAAAREESPAAGLSLLDALDQARGVRNKGVVDKIIVMREVTEMQSADPSNIARLRFSSLGDG
jgi:hypothetical protein